MKRRIACSLRLDLIAACLSLLAVTTTVNAQSLEEVLDEDRYLRGLTEWHLPEVMERFLELHPPDDAAGAISHQQHLDRLALRDIDRTAAEREAIVQRMIERYEKLLETHPDDPRRASWITDLASDAYFEWMMIDTSLWTALLGIPSRDQVDLVRRATKRMIDAAERAERIVLDVIFQLEDRPEFMDDLALQSERRRMTDEYRDRRVPFLRGIAAHLHARFNITDHSERTRLGRQAAETLNEVIPRLQGRLRHEAEIHAGFARLVEGDAARAANMLANVLDDEHASPLLRFAAAVGEAKVARPHIGDDAAMQTLEQTARDIGVADQLYYQLLLVDQRLSLPDRPSPRAYRAYLDLIDAQPDDRRESVRQVVFTRLAGHPAWHDQLSDAPPIVQIAHASAQTADAAEVDRGIERLTALRERADLNDRESAITLLILARLLAEANRPDDAASMLLELAGRYQRNPDASNAIEQALALAVEVYRASPSAGRPLLHEGLELLFTYYPNRKTVDHWRLVAGRLALNENQFDTALDHFERVSLDSEAWQEARFMQIEAIRRAAHGAPDAEARHRQLLDHIDDVERELLRESAKDESSRERLLLLSIYRAEAHVALNDARTALETLDELDEANDLPVNVLAELLPVRIQAYESLGQTERAGKEINRLVGASPDRVFELLLPMIDAARRRVSRLLDQHRGEDAVELARRELLPLAEHLKDWYDAHGSGEQTLIVGRRLADSYRYADECETALEWYDRLLEAHPNAMPLLIGRAECLFALGEDAVDPRLIEAMSIYRRVAAAGADRGEEPFWLSQLRMLQILDRIDRNTDRILPRIQQLRQRDPKLGGDFFRRQFEQLQTRHTP